MVLLLDQIFLRILDDIKTLKIQGATNIAIEGVKAFSSYGLRLEASSLEIFYNKMEKAKYSLSKVRPTEPALINGLRYILFKLREHSLPIDDTKLLLSDLSNEYIKLLKSSKKKVIAYGAERIEPHSVIMTHCHSSLSVGILLEAHRQGKNICVFCTETRPLYQGRTTAKELVEAGIDTTMVVDSAMRWVINTNNIDMILTGADAITSQGTIINKIGTRLLALAAKEMDIPFYTAVNILKYDPETSIGKLSEIEMRSPSEIWADPPSGLKFLNPAFETISHDLIDGLITEEGVFSSPLIFSIVKEKYPFMHAIHKDLIDKDYEKIR